MYHVTHHTLDRLQAGTDPLIMIALCNRANHDTFALWFLSFFFFISSPNLSRRRLDIYHTSTHGEALVRI